MNLRIGLARRVHALENYVKGSGWGTSPCGFGGRAQVTKDAINCTECRVFGLKAKEKIMLDVEGIKKEQAANKGGGRALKPGKNYFRIFLFNHKVTPADVANGVSIESNLGKTVQKPGRSVLVQFDGPGGRPVLSNPGSMKKYEALNGSNDKDDSKAAEKIRPQKKFACWFVDTSVKPSKLRCELLPMSVGQAIWDKAVDSDYGEKIFGSKGRDFVIKYDDKASSPKDFYKVDVRDKENCRVLPAQLDAEVKDLLAPGAEAHFGIKSTTAAKPVEEEVAEEAEAEAEEETTEESAESTEEVAEETEESTEEETEEASEPEEDVEGDGEDAEEKPAKRAAKKPLKKGKAKR